MRGWPTLRALLIGGVLAAACADALPLPELRPQHLKTAIGQEELKRWTATLNLLGLALTEEEVSAGGLVVGTWAQAFREGLVQPLAPLRTLFGTGQSWGLFAYPDPRAGRLVIETRTTPLLHVSSSEASEIEAGWQERFRAPQRGMDRLTRRMRYRRIRGIYDDAGDLRTPRPLYGRFADWVAREILREEPSVEAVQIRLDLVQIKLPGEGPEPPEKRRHAQIRTRSDLLPPEE